MSAAARSGTCVYLSGGVGGAKLALGLSKVLPASDLLIVANTGDDFEHLGLTICPDIDTLTYTLSGLANTETGWGRAGETARFMSALEALGGETWFFLGDSDLSIHVERSRRLAAGETLTAITADFGRRLGVECRLVPMSDDPVRTMVETAAGPLAFQHYFVRDRCEPVVTGFRFEGAQRARSHPDFLEALAAPSLRGVIIGPSNPFISIDPMLAVPGLARALRDAAAPVVAVSPIVAGRAIKGPTAKMMHELGLSVSVSAIAEHYAGWLDGLVIDDADAPAGDTIRAAHIAVLETKTVMRDLDDRVALAADVLGFVDRLRREAGGVLQTASGAVPTEDDASCAHSG